MIGPRSELVLCCSWRFVFFRGINNYKDKIFFLWVKEKEVSLWCECQPRPLMFKEKIL